MTRLTIWITSSLLLSSVGALSLPVLNGTLETLNSSSNPQHDLGPHAGDVRQYFFDDVAGELAFFSQFYADAADGAPRLYGVNITDKLPDSFDVDLGFYWYGSRDSAGQPRREPSVMNDLQYRIRLACNIKYPCIYSHEIMGRTRRFDLILSTFAWTTNSVPMSYHDVDTFRYAARNASSTIVKEGIRKPEPGSVDLRKKPFWTIDVIEHALNHKWTLWIDMQSRRIAKIADGGDASVS